MLASMRYEINMHVTCDDCGVDCNAFPRYQRGGDNYDLCKRCFETLMAAAPEKRFEFTVYPEAIKVLIGGLGSRISAAGGFRPIPPAALNIKCHFDGACQPNPGRGGCGVVILGVPGQGCITGVLPLGNLETSNSAEYQGLLAVIRNVARFLCDQGVDLGSVALDVYGDSELVVKQMRGEYEVHDNDLAMLHALATQQSSKYNRFDIHHVGRTENAEADSLAKQAVTHSLPAESVVDYSPNLAGHSAIEVYGDGWFRTVRAANDLGTRIADDPQAHCLIDAAFLASFPTAEGFTRIPPIQRALRNVKPHPKLRLLRSNGPSMTVLGTVELELGLPSHKFKATALVIHKLPVPLHIVNTNCPRVRGGMHATNSTGGLRAALFPEQYREHRFWLAARLRPDSSATSQRSPRSRRRSRSRSRSRERERDRSPARGGSWRGIIPRGGLFC